MQTPSLPLGLKEDFSPCDPFLSSPVAELGKARFLRDGGGGGLQPNWPSASLLLLLLLLFLLCLSAADRREGEKGRRNVTQFRLWRRREKECFPCMGKSFISHTKKCRWKQMWSLKEMSQHKALRIKIVFWLGNREEIVCKINNVILWPFVPLLDFQECFSLLFREMWSCDSFHLRKKRRRRSKWMGN